MPKSGKFENLISKLFSWFTPPPPTDVKGFVIPWLSDQKP